MFLKVRRSFLDAENEIDSHIILDLKAARVTFNERYLESIFVNLISNAVKYRHPSRKLEISLRSFLSKEGVIIEFTDNGIGIDMKRHGERLLECTRDSILLPKAKDLVFSLSKVRLNL